MLRLALAFLPGMAAANQPCMTHDDWVDRLKNQFGETRVNIGLTDDGHLIETFRAENGDWSILLTTPQGISCMVSHGYAFSQDPVGVKG